MERTPDGIAVLLGDSQYARDVFRKGLSYSAMSEMLSEHFNADVARGSIHYFFKTAPKERKAWEQARKRPREKAIKQAANLACRVLELMEKREQKDPAFRDTLAYYNAFPTAVIHPARIYRALSLLHKGGQYITELHDKTELPYYVLHRCCDISGITLPDGRTESRRIIPHEQEKKILSYVSRYGHSMTARKLKLRKATVWSVANRNGVSSPFEVGRRGYRGR